jgi:hypothetical protein
LLIEQHDHGMAAGEFARCFARAPRPLGPTLYAVANHDRAWRELDEEVPWNEERDRLHSFVSYPPKRKLPAQRRGIDLVEEEDPYAACLCSMHHARFLEGSENPVEVRFREAELERQERLRAGMPGEHLAELERNFRFLRLCDGLSLFVCLNEPGGSEQPPPYPGGFELDGERFEPVWEDANTLRFEPNPFAESFGISIPFSRVSRDRRPLGGGRIALQVRN